MELKQGQNGCKIGCKTNKKKKGENKMHEIIEFQFAYAGWATEKLFVVLEKISKEEYNAPGCSGHGSIRDTLAHCLSAEQGWFLWFDKSMSVSDSMAVRLKSEEIETMIQAREHWQAIRQRTERCIRSLTENEMLVICCYTARKHCTPALEISSPCRKSRDSYSGTNCFHSKKTWLRSGKL
jgi:hypothetical protein